MLYLVTCILKKLRGKKFFYVYSYILHFFQKPEFPFGVISLHHEELVEQVLWHQILLVLFYLKVSLFYLFGVGEVDFTEVWLRYNKLHPSEVLIVLAVIERSSDSYHLLSCLASALHPCSLQVCRLGAPLLWLFLHLLLFSNDCGGHLGLSFESSTKFSLWISTVYLAPAQKRIGSSLRRSASLLSVFFLPASACFLLLSSVYSWWCLIYCPEFIIVTGPVQATPP